MTVLILGVLALATWCSPLRAQNEIDRLPPPDKNAIGIQFGIHGGHGPFVKPFIAQLFSNLDVICSEESECEAFQFSTDACCETPLAVAHFCPGGESCVVCPQVSFGGHEGGGEHPELIGQLVDALSANARLEAELAAREAFEEIHRDLAAELQVKEIENAELRAELRIAEQRHELQRQLMETTAENIRLQGQVELAQQKEQFLNQYAKGVIEKLQTQLATVAHHNQPAEHGWVKVVKGKGKHKHGKSHHKAKGHKHAKSHKHAKGHDKVAKSKKGGKHERTDKAKKHGDDIRTAERPEETEESGPSR